MYRITGNYGDNFLFNGHKNFQVGSGSVINWPPGSEIQGYGSRHPDPKEFYGSTTKKCNLTLSLFLYISGLKVEKPRLLPVGLLDVLGCDLLAAVHASHRLAQPDETTDIRIGRSTESINDSKRKKLYCGPMIRIHASPPPPISPVSKLAFFLSLPVCRRSS
jgi:hypothetical protein